MSGSPTTAPGRAPDDRPGPSDQALVQRAAGGDPHAFEVLVGRYQQQMFRVALRITGRRGDAEDAAQNAFLAAWRRLPQFRHDAAFGTWLYRIVTNQALNVVRAREHRDRERDVSGLPDAAQPVTAEPGPHQHAQTGALADELRAALAELSPELRLCWYAREIDGYSYQEVADIAGVTLDTARGRIVRARRRLAATLEGWR